MDAIKAQLPHHARPLRLSVSLKPHRDKWSWRGRKGSPIVCWTFSPWQTHIYHDSRNITSPLELLPLSKYRLLQTDVWSWKEANELSSVSGFIEVSFTTLLLQQSAFFHLWYNGHCILRRPDDPWLETYRSLYRSIHDISKYWIHNYVNINICI